MRLIAFLTRMLPATFLLAAPFVSAGQTPPATQPLDDPLESLSARATRGEEDEDRLDALAHFSAGRVLQQRQQFKQALRQYERALRLDDAAGPALRDLVPLAFAAGRNDEGLRYLVKYAEQSTIEPELLEQAADYIAESGDWKGAIRLDERALAETTKGKPSPQQVQLSLQLGRLYALTEQDREAAAALKQVMKALEDPDKYGLDAKQRKNLLGDGGANYELMGTVFLEAKRVEDAKAAYEKFDSITPDPAMLALNMARCELAAGKPQAALDELQKCTAAKTPVPTIAPYELLAKAMAELKQSDQLLPRLEEMRKAQPKNIMLAYFLGQQYFDAGKFEKAQELLEEVQSQKPTIQSYRRLAEVYRRTGQTEKLLELLGQMIEKGGSLAPLGSDGKEMAADDKLVSSLVETAQKKYGGAADADFDTLKSAALIAGQAKRWDDAEKLFNLAIKARPKAASELLLSWGLGLFLDEKYDRAAAVFQRGIDDKNLADENASLYFYLAGALEMQGKTDEALAAAKTAAEKDPKNANMASRPAWILYHGKRYDAAAKAYEAIVEKFDDDFTTDGARDLVREARSALSNLCVIRHDVPPAVEWLQQVLDEFPDDPGANNDLGYLWADENQHLHRAYRMIQLAVAAEPDNYAYRDSLGWVLHRLGRDGEALVQLQKAVEPDKPEGEVLDHLGEVYAKLGQTGEAQGAWKRSAEAYKKAGEEGKMKAVEKKMTKAE
jgi:tetratricopeptide (TPR) repeat protein